MKKNDLDAELAELGRLMFEEGLSPWLAAKTMRARGMSSRSQSTLFHHAGRLDERHLGAASVDVSWAVERIAACESVLVSAGDAQELKRALEMAGLVVETRVRKAIQFSPSRTGIGG